MALQIIVYILFFIFAVFATQALHELGHILGGFMCGYNFRLLVIGPFGFRKSKDGKISFYIEHDKTMWQGASVTLPDEPYSITSRQVTMLLFAGLVLSLVIGLAFAPLALSTHSYYAIVISALSLAYGISSFFPSKRSASFSDGWTLSSLRRGGAIREEELRYYRVTRLYAADKTTENISFEDLDALSKSKDRIKRFVAVCLMYWYYLERGEKPSAKNAMKQLERLAEKIPRKYFRKYCRPMGMSEKKKKNKK